MSDINQWEDIEILEAIRVKHFLAAREWVAEDIVGIMSSFPLKIDDTKITWYLLKIWWKSSLYEVSVNEKWEINIT